MTVSVPAHTKTICMHTRMTVLALHTQLVPRFQQSRSAGTGSMQHASALRQPSVSPWHFASQGRRQPQRGVRRLLPINDGLPNTPHPVCQTTMITLGATCDARRQRDVTCNDGAAACSQVNSQADHQGSFSQGVFGIGSQVSAGNAGNELVDAQPFTPQLTPDSEAPATSHANRAPGTHMSLLALRGCRLMHCVSTSIDRICLQ